jgi:hypothetical protein
MKKYITGCIIALIVVLIYNPIKATISNNQTENQSISFQVYKGSDYTAAAYNTASAKINILVEKVTGSKRTSVWQQTIDARALNQYPDVQNALSKTITVNGISNTKEHLEVTYTLIYNAQGTELQMKNGTVLSNTANNNKIMISI